MMVAANLPPEGSEWLRPQVERLERKLRKAKKKIKKLKKRLRKRRVTYIPAELWKKSRDLPDTLKIMWDNIYRK